MRDIVLCSGNSAKLQTLNYLAEDSKYKGLFSVKVPESIDVKEDGATFQENAHHKLREYMKAYRNEFPCAIFMAEDSGLQIQALYGEPGVYSRRYLGEDVPYEDKMKNILSRMENEKNRGCRYFSYVAVAVPSLNDTGIHPTFGFEGVWNGLLTGVIVDGPTGFAYDPIFIPMNVCMNKKYYISEYVDKNEGLEENLIHKWSAANLRQDVWSMSNHRYMSFSHAFDFLLENHMM